MLALHVVLSLSHVSQTCILYIFHRQNSYSGRLADCFLRTKVPRGLKINTSENYLPY